MTKNEKTYPAVLQQIYIVMPMPKIRIWSAKFSDFLPKMTKKWKNEVSTSSILESTVYEDEYKF